MQDWNLIIAIKRDREAPIFEAAHFGIVGDVFKIIPTMAKGLDHPALPFGQPAIGGAKS